ncbi:glycosyltransferase [soil metagenome]
MTPSDARVVVHSLPVWLPLTATWICNHVRYLSPSWVNHVVCERTENLEQFRIPNIHSLETAGHGRYIWDKALRKLGVRDHLGYLVATARRHRAVLIHSHWGDTGWRDRGVPEAVGCRHVVTFYGKDVNYFPVQDPVWRDRYRELFSRVHRVLCEGSHMKECILRLGCPSEKVTVQHLGVDIDRIPFRPRAWDGKGHLRMLLAGSFREKKGFPYALEAAGRLKREGLGMEVTIIGDASNDPRSHREKKRIIETIARWRLESCTKLLGYQPHAALFEQAYRHHIFVSPSVTAGDGDTEGGAPVTVIEMMATGMPIVSTTHCDIPSIVIPGRTGLLSDERDVDGLVQNILWLVENPEAWEPLVREGRRHIEREYDVARQADRLSEIYRRVLDPDTADTPTAVT